MFLRFITRTSNLICLLCCGKSLETKVNVRVRHYSKDFTHECSRILTKTLTIRHWTTKWPLKMCFYDFKLVFILFLKLLWRSIHYEINLEMCFDHPKVGYNREFSQIVIEIVRHWTTFMVGEYVFLRFQTSTSGFVCLLWYGKSLEIRLKVGFKH